MPIPHKQEIALFNGFMGIGRFPSTFPSSWARRLPSSLLFARRTVWTLGGLLTCASGSLLVSLTTVLFEWLVLSSARVETPLCTKYALPDRDASSALPRPPTDTLEVYIMILPTVISCP